ncbi:MAG: benzylsuccinate synthase, partial [Clostridiales bacterium]|nr:benzylsuccinate synthase [Clostridiales bacterium]
MFKNRSKVLFVANFLGALYAIYLMAHFIGVVGSTEGAEQVGAGLATALIMPHFVMILLSVIFGMLGFFLRKDGFNLTSGILYCVATAVFLFYFMFTLPLVILAFV